MASVRDLRKRLKAVSSTQKITKAMKMVSASKLKRAQDAIVTARPFAIRSKEVIDHVLSHADLVGHPLLTGRAAHRVELVVLSSDRGLCGSFNSNIIRAGERFISENTSRFEQIEITTIGKKGRDHFKRRGRTILADYEGVSQRPSFERAAEIAGELIGRFNSGRIDAVFMVYNEFKSAISQKVVVTPLLPLEPLEVWAEHPMVKVGEMFPYSKDPGTMAGRSMDVSIGRGELPSWAPERLEMYTEGFEHEFEPSREEVLNELLPQYLGVQVWRAILESTAAEHGARMAAMDAASRNAKEMIEKLTLTMNRARQAAITKELMEIIGGAEALKA
ncbi:MAG: ATP synthase F1 subunit gamma [Deltaproteobacteria bacterium]|nr:ATP synthase F1 subunit gamma [Deltaproteobacteria bacterium]